MQIKLITILYFLCLSTIGSGFEFSVRDSQTGAAISADIVVRSIDSSQLTPQQWRRIKLGQNLPSEVFIIKQEHLLSRDHFFHLTPNKHLQVISISAPGYQSLQSYISAESHIPITQIMLDKTTQNIESLDVCHQTHICGYIYDQATIQALTDVAVTVSGEHFYQQVFTNQNGAFYFSEPLPKNVAIQIEHPGYQSQRRTDLDTTSPIKMVIDLEQGHDQKNISMLHPLINIDNNSIDPDWLNAKLNHHASNETFTKERASGAVFLEPPNSIRVGFNGAGGSCCGSNCATSQVYSLETYVQRGLDNEWISSWDADSLKAGSIPYRSYGAWHVLNQVYNGYDICAGPCCQAFEFTGFITTIEAGIATNGIMLDQNGEIARSEYSAQNNSWDDPDDGLNCTNSDLSCGDGAVGSPEKDWPCLNDTVSTGLGCFGHGRGMSQWGTQFRAQEGESFADIVDDYYNASNNPSGKRNQYASTPVRFDATTVNETVISENESILIDYEIFNASDNTHTFGPVLLGASLYDGNSYFSDPNNDLSFPINQAQTHVLQRPFQLNQNIQPSTYDLITAIYLDVDNDDQISATDWLLQVQTTPAAITVLAANDLIFRDGFN